MVLPADPGPLTRHYEAEAGRDVDGALLGLYALSWDLTELGIYLAQVRAPHSDTEDMRVAWRALEELLTDDRDADQ